MKKQKQKYRCMDDRKYRNCKTTGCPTKTFGHDRQCGFTLVELVIVIAIVIILSVISVPIYRGYVDKAKMAEGYALLGTILSAQKAYYSEYGNFFTSSVSAGGVAGNFPTYATDYNTVLGVDARGNKYFKEFGIYWGGGSEFPENYFRAIIKRPDELINNGKTYLELYHDIALGQTDYLDC